MRLKNWKEVLEVKRLKVNVGKIKVICSRHDAHDTKITSVKLPCGVCWEGVGANSILCLSCKKWVHKDYSGIRESLRNCTHFICRTYSIVAEADDPFPTCITIDGDEFETVSEFCYLGDAVTARI